jgi:hypothetical protein
VAFSASKKLNWFCGWGDRKKPSWLVCLRKSQIADGFFMESDAQHLKLF